GAGHRSAANAIVKAMNALEERSSPGGGHGADEHGQGRAATQWHAVIVDAFAECSRFPVRKGIFLYGPLTNPNPQLYGRLFRVTNTSRRFQMAYRMYLPFLRQGLRDLIERMQPDVIVSVHPLLNHATLLVRRDIGLRIPFLTVITDLFTVHHAWVARGV